MLHVDAIDVAYGPVKVLHQVSLAVKPGELVAIIGANGAGKTTLLKGIMGTLRPSTGSIRFGDERIDGQPPHRITRKGLVMVPEGRQVFANLTVWENLLMGAYPRLFGRGRQEAVRLAEQLLERFPSLKARRNVAGGVLSGGEQQMLAMARALMARPRLLMLDEPTLGLAPAVVSQLFELILQIRNEGTTILLVEQKAFRALEISDRAYLLETGRVVLSGKSAELLQNDYVAQFYLGGARSRAAEA